MRRPNALKLKTGRMNIVSKRITLARQKHSPAWTMEALSQALEEHTGLVLSIGTIGKIEAGIRGVFDYEVVAFAQTLEVDANWLLGLIDPIA
jgi:hypothetical protein